MASLRKRGKVYWMRYYYNGQRLYENTFTGNRDEAQRIAKQREGQIADGRTVSPTAARLTFDDAAADLETEYTINKRKSLGHLKRRLTLHLLPVFGGRRLAEINTPMMRTFVKARLAAGAANAEVNRELAIIKRAFRLAKQSGRFVGDVPHVPMLREDNVRKGFFERAQFDAVKARLPQALQAVVEFAYLTGWRVTSEVLPLEWRQIDFVDRVVRLDPGSTKNREGRTFPFTAALEALLIAQRAMRDQLQQTGRLVPSVFHRNGKPIKHFYAAWNTACTDAGCPGRLLHDFRRTAVKNLERIGVSRSAAMAMVGHKTESIYRRYAIVDATALREAAARIDAEAASPRLPLPSAVAGKKAGQKSSRARSAATAPARNLQIC